MHQHPQYANRVSTPDPSPPLRHAPRTAPQPRESPSHNYPPRLRSSSETAGLDEKTTTDARPPSSSTPSRDTIRKLDQIIQNFHYKAAVLVLQSRQHVTPVIGNNGEIKTNKWFQIETDDIEDFRDDLRPWRTCSSFDNRPQPMIIETYLDASKLSNSHSLVIADENGKRWDVLEMLNWSDSPTDESPRSLDKRRSEVVLERWRLELRSFPSTEKQDFGPILPTIYKKSIVFFRSLFVATRVLPSWKYFQQALSRTAVHPALQVKCRIVTDEPEAGGFDALRHPLYHGQAAVATDYMFGDLEVPVGRFVASVSFRNNCNLRVDDAESLLSSRFLGVDEHFFRPSLPMPHHHRPPHTTKPGPQPTDQAGSLPQQRHHARALVQELGQAYGSLSTFHGQGAPTGTSPISALRAIRPMGSEASSLAGSCPASYEPDVQQPSSISGHGSHGLSSSSAAATATARPGLRTLEGAAAGRRPSISFQPFKAGSLSGSPRVDAERPPSPSPPLSSLPLTIGAATRAGSSGSSGPSSQGASKARPSLTAGMAASLHTVGPGPSVGAETGAAAVTGGAKPPAQPSRYSSSFSHRRGRYSFGGHSNRTGDDDQASSGKQSLSSSSAAQPGSGLLAELSANASSGSLTMDDDNISEFLKALDNNKTLPSFEAYQRNSAAAAKRTAAQLSKFQMMRDANNMLTDSMQSSSMQLQRSSLASSRQLVNANVPSSISTSPSPAKPLSPHTPHTPAIPSRLSENSIIEYDGHLARTRRWNRDHLATAEEEADPPQQGPSAIDIPVSPQLMHMGADGRRSNSTTQAHRAMLDGEDDDDEVLPPTLSGLLCMQRSLRHDTPSPTAEEGAVAMPDLMPAGARPRLVDWEERRSTTASSSSAGAPAAARYRRRGGGTSSPHSLRASYSGGSLNRGENELDEDLLFTMSELGRDVRRSLDEGRTVPTGPGTPCDTPGRFDRPRGTSRRGW